MNAAPEPLPFAPLLRNYLDAAFAAPGAVDPRTEAVRAAREGWLNETFLDAVPDAELAGRLLAFYEAVVRPPLHRETLRRRVRLVRHGLNHLLRCADSLPQKLERCLRGGPYAVGGLGFGFWAAVAQALDPETHPGWTPATERGLRRLGLLRRSPSSRPGTLYARLLEAYRRLRAVDPRLTALHVDHFLGLVAAMRGRELAPPKVAPPALLRERSPDAALPDLVRQERTRLPLRRRLKERGGVLEEARRQLEAGLRADDPDAVWSALQAAEPANAARTNLNLTASGAALLSWAKRLWDEEDPWPVLEEFWQEEPIPNGGLWLPAAVLHLKDPRSFPPWDDVTRQGLAALDDGFDPAAPPAEGYRLFAEASAELCAAARLHPLEVPAVLAALATFSATPQAAGAETGPARFGGFCGDTFRFLAELNEHNQRAWMERQRERYRFAVREPLVELCRALAERYVEPVLRREHGWDLETEARTGRALTSICKNDYGRSAPYQATLWVAFYRRDQGGKRDDVQFFVRLDAGGLTYGLQLGRTARAAGRLFRRNVQEHAEDLFRALSAGGGLAACRFGPAEGSQPLAPVAGPADLRACAAGKSLMAARTLPPDSPLLLSDDLVGEILLTFDRLLPAYVCAVEADPVPFLRRRGGPAEDGPCFDAQEFRRTTHLGGSWLDRALGLLELKKQLILQGVPGTGKTHVARSLARLLTRDRPEAVRLVQFHPAYSYEEFVEGIKARTVEVNGRHEVTYPVEDGVLCEFAAQAARRPAEPHVLLIDEINRGNLPRIFGELLYLLEYRDQAVSLPYSRRPFRLPANLYLIGTMNGADRSVALVDQALRRRFSFLDMPPDPAVLAAWLEAHPPKAGEAFGQKVVALFESLNRRLGADLGPNFQVGHSYFMVPELDEARLRVVWDHHVRPLLEEYFAVQPARAAAYEFESLWGGKSRRGAASPER